MPNAPVHSYNTRVYWSANGSSYTELTGVISAVLPELATTAAPSDSLTDVGKITVAGKADLGELEIEMLFDRAVYNTILNTLYRNVGNAGTDYYYRVQFPDATPVTSGSRVDFRGYLRVPGMPSADDDAVLRHSVMIKINSFPTFTPAS